MSPPVTDSNPTIDPRRSWTVLAILGRHLWPKGELGLRSRVVVALTLLVLAKVANVYVPLLYKRVIDALGTPQAQLMAVPIALILGLWRGPRAGPGLR